MKDCCAAASCTDHESCLLAISFLHPDSLESLLDVVLCSLMIIPCVGILSPLPIKALIYLVEKTFAATEEKPFPNKCPCCV